MTTKRIVERFKTRERTVFADVEAKPEPEVPDMRSPLERFRTKPKRCLTVTDIVSPAWCELQYWYSLTKHGRKRRTPAMRQGSAVHKTLEEQVHRTVVVDLQTKEDMWGLRIWNIIEGLKSLRETGMTREFEVWGIVDGEVVNGKIDELSLTCPDQALEDLITARTAHGRTKKKTRAADQAAITNFMKSGDDENPGTGVLQTLRSSKTNTLKVYITDVKTRGVKSVPSDSAFLSTRMQLMMYRRLLSDTVSGKVNLSILSNRYGFDAAASFSDAFIAEVGSLNAAFDNTPQDTEQSQGNSKPAQDPVEILLEHNSPHKLWNLMRQEFQKTMPAGIDSVGNLLKAEFRNPKSGDIQGVQILHYDEDVLQSYLKSEMSWWKGKREAKGVCIEDAYRCRSCEFAEECTWRKTKIEEATESHRAWTKSVV